MNEWRSAIIFSLIHTIIIVVLAHTVLWWTIPIVIVYILLLEKIVSWMDRYL